MRLSPLWTKPRRFWIAAYAESPLRRTDHLRPDTAPHSNAIAEKAVDDELASGERGLGTPRRMQAQP